MSKNYTNYSKPNEAKKQDEVAQVPVETAIGVVDPDPAQVPVMAVAPEVDEQTSTSVPVPDPEPIIGVVSNCKMLNVRAKPDKKAEPERQFYPQTLGAETRFAKEKR